MDGQTLLWNERRSKRILANAVEVREAHGLHSSITTLLIVGDHTCGICEAPVSDNSTPRSRTSFRRSGHSHVCDFRSGFQSATDNGSASPA